MKRKLLLIMPNFFDYPQAICEELEKMGGWGYEVDCFDDRPSTNGMVKAIILNGQKFVQSMQVHKKLMLQIMSQRITAHHLLCLFVQLAIDKNQWLIKIERK